MMIAPVAANITRLFGMRSTLMCGVLLQTAALIGASFATKLWHLFLSQGVCFGWGIGLQYNSTVAIIPQWFLKRRSLASGIAAAGSGAGGLIYSLASNAMIQSIEVPWTYRVLAIVTFVVNTICALLCRDRNKQVGSRPAAVNVRLFRLLPYCFFLGWCFLSVIGFTTVLFSLGDYARSIGLTARQGSTITALLNLGQCLGRPTIGLLSDVLGRLNVAAFTTSLCALLCFVGWIFARDYGSILVVSLLLGSVVGTVWTVCSSRDRVQIITD
jgi:MFS family permease